jgi:hypothetical protein
MAEHRARFVYDGQADLTRRELDERTARNIQLRHGGRMTHDHRVLLSMSDGTTVNEWADLTPGGCGFVPFDLTGRLPDEVRVAVCRAPATNRWQQTLLDVDGQGAELEQFALLCAEHAPVVANCAACCAGSKTQLTSS